MWGKPHRACQEGGKGPGISMGLDGVFRGGGGLEVPGLSEPPRRKAASSHPETQADLLEQMEQFTLSFKAGIDLGFGPRGGSRTRPFLVGTAVVAEVGDPGMNC